MNNLSEQPVFVQYSPDRNIGINLVALVKTIWDRKWLLASTIAIAVTLAILYLILATPVYRSSALLSINQYEQGPSLSGKLAGLGSLAGLDFGSSVGVQDALATLQSDLFVEEFIVQNDLMPVLFADKWDESSNSWGDTDPEEWPKLQEAVSKFIEDVFAIEEDAATGLIRISVDWSDPELSASWVEILIRQINERLRSRDLERSERRLVYLQSQFQESSLLELRQAIARLIESEIQTMTLAKADDEYAFRVIDPPRVPVESIAPAKLAILILAVLLGGLIGLAIIVVNTWLTDKEALEAPVQERE